MDSRDLEWKSAITFIHEKESLSEERKRLNHLHSRWREQDERDMKSFPTFDERRRAERLRKDDERMNADKAGSVKVAHELQGGGH